MRYLPMFHDISGRSCLVVGAGPVAARKIMMLRRAEARVTVIAPGAIDAVRDLHYRDYRGAIHLHARPFAARDVAGHTLVIAATGDRAVDKAVSRAARAAGISVNVVDRPDISDFIMPAIIDRDPVIVAVSSAGTAPVLARRIRAAIEAMLPAGLGKIAAAASALRATVRDRIESPRARRRFWENYFRGWRRGRVADNADVARSTAAPSGGVSLVGAGPGDPELLTLRALQRLQDADIIIHDRLVGEDILDYARRDAEVIDVGKAPGKHHYSQTEINALLAHHANSGKQVVRLKGGDPMIFGRGGEERDYLLARGIEVEIVPGITAALGCAATAGISLTHRGTARALTLLTGTVDGHAAAHDWEALVRGGSTLAVYMGVGTAAVFQEQLIAHGMDPATPVAVIENGTLAEERRVTATLAGLGELITAQAIRAPALLVIGTVAGQAEADAGIADALYLAAVS